MNENDHRSAGNNRLAGLARPASLMRFLRARPPEEPQASWFGRVQMMLPGEEWPSTDDRAWWPLLQVDCRELPYGPPTLAGIEFLTVFVDPTVESLGLSSGIEAGWLLRTYSSIFDLVQVAEPERQAATNPHDPRHPTPPPKAKPIDWTLINTDYPAWECLMNLPNWQDFVDEDKERAIPVEGTKIGGWPFVIQQDPWESIAVDHVLQLDSHDDAGWSWGHGGIAYIGRRVQPPGDWLLTWQTY